MTEQDILLLETHRGNLETAKTFEEYRDVHVAYVTMLIEQMRARQTERAAALAYLEVTAETNKGAEETKRTSAGGEFDAK